MRYLLYLGIVLCSVQHFLVAGSVISSSGASPREAVVDSPLRTKRFDPYPYDDGRDEHLDKRFDQYTKRFDAYEKRFDPYQKRFGPYAKRFDPYHKRIEYDVIDKRFDPFEKRFDPYQKRFMVQSIRNRRVDFAPIDARAFFVALG